MISNNFNFDKPCPEIKTEIKFPSCWDGKNLWLDDMSHMAYPQRILYGRKSRLVVEKLRLY